ncbi:MAG TPA: hypothetical protein VFZ11_14795 [Gemmatimonadaceae bacterium]
MFTDFPSTTPTESATAPRTLEIARFTTRRDDEPAFLASHAAAIAAVRAAFPALLSVTTVRFATDDGRTTWADVAVWSSPEEAERAAATCMSIPEFAACAHFMESDLGVDHGEIVARH